MAKRAQFLQIFYDEPVSGEFLKHAVALELLNDAQQGDAVNTEQVGQFRLGDSPGEEFPGVAAGLRHVEAEAAELREGVSRAGIGKGVVHEQQLDPDGGHEVLDEGRMAVG